MTPVGRRLTAALGALILAAVVVAPRAGAEATRPNLGAAQSYVVVADHSITSSGSTAITGDVAIAASSALIGFPPGTIDGETHLADQEALDVAGATTAVNQNLQDQPCNSDRSGEDLGGLRLGGAVYCYIEDATLDGELRLDALGDVDTAWVFRVNGALDIAPASAVILANGAQSCNVFWQVDGNVTIGAFTSMVGTVVSEETIVLADGVTIDGRLFTPQGGVVLSATTVSQSACAQASDEPTTTTTDPGTTSTTDPSTTTIPTDTSAPAPGDGSGTDEGSGTGSGSDSGDGLALTGAISLLLALTALGALGAGHVLVGTERVVAWNARRWRPRHAQPRVQRLRPRRRP